MPTPIYQRALETTIRKDMGIYPVVAVMGARQVGKSTLCARLAQDLQLTACTLDERDVLTKALETPEVLLDELGPRAFIDEAQRAPGLFLAIKAVVDRDQKPGAYLISGSNQPKITGSVSDTLLGRVAYRTLRPMLMSELRFSEEHPGWSFLFDSNDQKVVEEVENRALSSGALDWREVVTVGGFPRAIAASVENRQRIIGDYVDVFVHRDIRDVLGVESPRRFEDFFRIICTWTGQEFNSSAIASDLGLSPNTIRRWTDALERSYLAERIAPYHNNTSQRIIKSPKLYVTDPALAIVASRETEPTGFHLETLICNDLLQWRDEHPSRGVFHWRLNSGEEVDFVIQQNQQSIPMEIKSTTTALNRHTKHLRKFLDTHSKAQRGLLITCDPEIRFIDDKILAAPWWGLL